MSAQTLFEFLPPPSVLWATVLVVLFLFGVISIVLVYHWKNYSFDLRKIKKVMPLYFGVAAIFFFTTILSAMLYTVDVP